MFPFLPFLNFYVFGVVVDKVLAANIAFKILLSDNFAWLALVM